MYLICTVNPWAIPMWLEILTSLNLVLGVFEKCLLIIYRAWTLEIPPRVNNVFIPFSTKHVMTLLIRHSGVDWLWKRWSMSIWRLDPNAKHLVFFGLGCLEAISMLLGQGQYLVFDVLFMVILNTRNIVYTNVMSSGFCHQTGGVIDMTCNW